jgi:hypothetical protein
VSILFVNAVYKTKTGKSSKKSVLLALADRANEDGICFPSIEDTVERTELNRKTVEKCLAQLVAGKFIVDTGQRVGKTKQVIVWQLDYSVISASKKEAPQKRIPSTFADKQPQIGVETAPETGYVTTSEPPSKPCTSSLPKTASISVDPGELNEYVEAAIWQCQKYNREIKYPAGFKQAVRKRIMEKGPNPEDIEARDQYLKAKNITKVESNLEVHKPRVLRSQEGFEQMEAIKREQLKKNREWRAKD